MGAMDLMTTKYVVDRMTIPTGMIQSEFRSLFEDAVPSLPRDQVLGLEARGAPWGEMVDLIEEAAPWGFLIYWTNDVDRLVHLAGDSSSAVAYLMGNAARASSDSTPAYRARTFGSGFPSLCVTTRRFQGSLQKRPDA